MTVYQMTHTIANKRFDSWPWLCVCSRQLHEHDRYDDCAKIWHVLDWPRGNPMAISSSNKNLMEDFFSHQNTLTSGVGAFLNHCIDEFRQLHGLEATSYYRHDGFVGLRDHFSDRIYYNICIYISLWTESAITAISTGWLFSARIHFIASTLAYNWTFINNIFNR